MSERAYSVSNSRFVVEAGNERPTSRPFGALRDSFTSAPMGAFRDETESETRRTVRSRPTLETAAARLTPVPMDPRMSSPGVALKVAAASLPPSPRRTPAPPAPSEETLRAIEIEERRRRRAERATRETAPMKRIERDSEYPEITVEPASVRPVRSVRETAPMTRVAARPASKREAPSGVRSRVVVETTLGRTASDPRRER